MRQRDRVGAHNERIKLLANSINAIGLAFVALGVVRPLVDRDVGMSIETIGYIAGALAIHVLAHYIVSQVEVDQ